MSSLNLPSQIAKHFRDVHFGGNWTAVNLKDTLADVDWEQAITHVYELNSISALVYHMNYFVDAVLKVLQGGPLDAHDKYSFDCPPITSPEDWQNLVTKTLGDAERFAVLVEQLPEEKFGEDFSDSKYGSYYRNIHGIVEHVHYHLGQITLIKKIIHEVEDDGEEE